MVLLSKHKKYRKSKACCSPLFDNCSQFTTALQKPLPPPLCLSLVLSRLLKQVGMLQANTTSLLHTHGSQRQTSITWHHFLGIWWERWRRTHSQTCHAPLFPRWWSFSNATHYFFPSLTPICIMKPLGMIFCSTPYCRPRTAGNPPCPVHLPYELSPDSHHYQSMSHSHKDK